jgi:hypothetical protein
LLQRVEKTTLARCTTVTTTTTTATTATRGSGGDSVLTSAVEVGENAAKGIAKEDKELEHGGSGSVVVRLMCCIPDRRVSMLAWATRRGFLEAEGGRQTAPFPEDMSRSFAAPARLVVVTKTLLPAASPSAIRSAATATAAVITAPAVPMTTTTTTTDPPNPPAVPNRDPSSSTPDSNPSAASVSTAKAKAVLAATTTADSSLDVNQVD